MSRSTDRADDVRRELRLRLDRCKTASSGGGRRRSCAFSAGVGALAAAIFSRRTWWGISSGWGLRWARIGLTMLHHLVGGSWGLVIRRPLEAGAATVPLWLCCFCRSHSGFRHSIPGHAPERRT